MGLLDGIMGHASEVSLEKVSQEFGPILVEDEVPEKVFKVLRDMFVFTNKRLILIDKQGLTGRKIDFLTIPYHSIRKFSKESSGLLDLDAELKIWVSGDQQPIKKEFRKDHNVNEVYTILSKYTLNH